jgi:tetratricopeptide (TPR) repeat protein
LYATLAKTEQERGDFDKATRLWRRSLDELDSLGWEQPVAETWNNLALVFRERNMPREARDALSRATQLAISTSHHRLRPWLELTRAQLVLDENKHAESEVIATAVIQDRSAPARARAEAQLILAEALADRKVPGQRIRKCFEDALVLAANQPAGVRARILRRYADALEAQGDLRGSVVRLREALELVRPETVKGTR